MSENAHHGELSTSKKALIWVELVSFGSLLAYFLIGIVKHVLVVYLGLGGGAHH
ncbi:MAG: hypothetical protein AB1498_13275 [bacterium]